jgi:hypothetical protein
MLTSRFGFCRFFQDGDELATGDPRVMTDEDRPAVPPPAQPSGRTRPITLGQQAVWNVLSSNAGRLLSPHVPLIFDEIVSDAEALAMQSQAEAPSREQLALELVMLIEHGLVRVEALPLRRG